MKKIVKWGLGLFFICVLVLITRPSVRAAEQQDFKLTIVHTNDVHSNVDIEPYVKGYADQLRAKGEHVLLVSAGDAFNGTSFASLSDGMDVVTVMNMVGYDVFTVGNHELAFTNEKLNRIIEAVDFPVLGANVNPQVRAEVPGIKDYIIEEIAGVKIAIIGVGTANTDSIAGDVAVEAINRAKAAAEMEGATLFIGITHLGVTGPIQDSSLYIARQCPWLDVIIDAHDHSAHQSGYLENNILICETGEYGNNIGTVEITVSGGKAAAVSAGLISIKGSESTCGIVPDAEVKAFIDTVYEKNAFMRETVFTTPVELLGERSYSRCHETFLGDAITNAMTWKTGTQAALIIGPYIRSNLGPGAVTREELYECVGNNADIIICELPGEKIFSLINEGLVNYPQEYNGIIHFSGMAIEFDSSRDAAERLVRLLWSDGTEVKGNELITVAGRLDLLHMFFDEDAVEGTHYQRTDYRIGDVFIDYVNSGKVELSQQAMGYWRDLASDPN